MPKDPVHVPSEDVESFAADDAMTIYDCIGKDDADQVSLVMGELDGAHGTFINHRSEKLYHMLAGEMTLETDDDSYTLTAGDSLLIPPNVPHRMEGTGRMIIATGPPFDPEDEERIDALPGHHAHTD